MTARIGNTEVTTEGCDWGVEYHDPTIGAWVFEAEDETEARQVLREAPNGKLVARDVYVTAWAEVES